MCTMGRGYIGLESSIFERGNITQTVTYVLSQGVGDSVTYFVNAPTPNRTKKAPEKQSHPTIHAHN